MGYMSDRTSLQSNNPTALLPAPLRTLATSSTHPHQGQISTRGYNIATHLPVPIIPSSRIDDSTNYPG
jgi:hypothetical protein